MGLSHPPGWDNISPDVKIGGYSCLKSENTEFLPQCGDRFYYSHLPGWDNISPDVKMGAYSCHKSENVCLFPGTFVAFLSTVGENQSSGCWCKRTSMTLPRSYMYWRDVATRSCVMTLCFEQLKRH